MTAVSPPLPRGLLEEPALGPVDGEQPALLHAVPGRVRLRLRRVRHNQIVGLRVESYLRRLEGEAVVVAMPSPCGEPHRPTVDEHVVDGVAHDVEAAGGEGRRGGWPWRRFGGRKRLGGGRSEQPVGLAARARGRVAQPGDAKCGSDQAGEVAVITERLAAERERPRIVSESPANEGFGAACRQAILDGPSWEPALDNDGRPGPFVVSPFVCTFDVNQ